MYILLFAAAVMMGAGLYMALCAWTQVPTGKTIKMMMLTGKRKGGKKEKLLDVYVTRAAVKLKRFVHLDTLHQAKIQTALDVTDQAITPEVYLLKACIKAALIAFCGLPFLPVIPFFFLIAVSLSVTVWFGCYYSALDSAKKRKVRIELELPRFTAALSQGLQNSRDVLTLLTSYRKIAGKDLGKELDLTIAEMKTGNYEHALIHLESRVGSPLLSDVSRGLIGTIRGDDQSMYFRMIAFDMRQLEQAALKKEAAKRPRQIQKYSMFMLFCILVIYGVVLGTEIAGSLGLFFV